MLRVRECEVIYRTRTSEGSPVRVIRSSTDIATILEAHTHRVQESIWTVLLDARKKVLAVHEAARGGIANCGAELSDIFRAAIVVGARAIVVAHNHPSGDPQPSQDDINYTRTLLQASEILGIPVLDHVIISSSGHFSMLDSGIVAEFRNGKGKR